jgi:hypothetical protein
VVLNTAITSLILASLWWHSLACLTAVDAVEYRGEISMPRKSHDCTLPLRLDRELIQLAKTKTLGAIVDQMQRSPAAIIKRASMLGLKIKGSKGGRGSEA